MSDRYAEILSECLQAAVSLEAYKFAQEVERSGISLEWHLEWERQNNALIQQEAAVFLVGSPDQWKGKTGTFMKSATPGMPAAMFAKLARHIAVMSFLHEGIEFLGVRYSAKELGFEPAQTNGRSDT